MEKLEKPEILPPDPEAMANMKRVEDSHGERAETHASGVETGSPAEKMTALRQEILGAEGPHNELSVADANAEVNAQTGGGGAGWGKIGKVFKAGWNFFKKVLKVGLFAGLLGFSYGVKKIKIGKDGKKGGGDSHGAAPAKAPSKPSGGGSKGGGGGGHGHH